MFLPNTEFRDATVELGDAYMQRRFGPLRLSELSLTLHGPEAKANSAVNYWVNFTHFLRLSKSHDADNLLRMKIITAAYPEKRSGHHFSSHSHREH
jgi:hypothetical protein